MINLSIQNIIPFLVQHLSPQDWRESKKRSDWNRSGPCGAHPGYKILCVPVSFLWEKSFSLLDLPWVPKGRFKQLLIRRVKECRNKGYIEIWHRSLSSSTGTGAPPRGGWWLQAEYKHRDPRLVGTTRLMMEIPGAPSGFLPTNQSEEGHTPGSPPPKFCL